MTDDQLPEMIDDDFEDDEELFEDEIVSDDDLLDVEALGMYEGYEDDTVYADVIENTLDRFMAVASTDAVFAEPIHHGDILIIPAAEVVSAMGFGMGSGSATSSEPTSSGGGDGGGGGGWNMARPVAVIIATQDSVRVEPVVDVTKIGIAALTTAGFIFGLFLRMLRPRR